MKYISKIQIKNYRKLKDVNIQLDKNFSVIAGSNNAGKTSIVELLSKLFGGQGSNVLSFNDINSDIQIKNIKALQEILEMDLPDDEKLSKIIEEKNDFEMITVDIDVSYTEDDIELSLFAPYLTSVKEHDRNFYFRLHTSIEPPKKEELIPIINNHKEFINSFFRLKTVILYCDQERSRFTKHFNSTAEFLELFNFKWVYAIRQLADTDNENTYTLSKHLLETAAQNKDWNNGLKEVVKQLNKTIKDLDLSTEVDNITLDSLKETVERFIETGGGHTGRLGVDFELENKDIEKVLLDFIKVYYEQENSSKIQEGSQGLGFSNLIYLLLTLKSFIDDIDNSKVNLILFEEPEAHLHPQMEKVFISHLRDHIRDKYQMIITSHSPEMVKEIPLNSVKVIRSISSSEGKVYDFNKFFEKYLDDEVTIDFYNKFFQFNMVEIIFADKVILFEGDAERLMLKYIISESSEFDALSNQFISYIQVGGAYAFRYKYILNFLEVRALLLTDIDYSYNNEDMDIEESRLLESFIAKNPCDTESRITTNTTLKDMLTTHKIHELYELQERAQTDRNIIDEDTENICIKYQGKKEGYARTLEDALIFTLINNENLISVFTKFSKENWDKIKEEYNLEISSSQKSETTIRDRVHKMENKTDFMYSLLNNHKSEEFLPAYIKEGLHWLQE